MGGCAYNCLRTCPAEQKVCVFDHEKYIKEVMLRRFGTKLTSTKRLLNGQNKLKNGRSPLWPVLNPRSHVSTQRVIAVLLQLQLKLKSTERDVKLKPSFGSSQRPLNLPVKLLLLKIRSSTELAGVG